MSESDITGKIWNRACSRGSDTQRPGDLALKAMLAFHGRAMNGGVLHSLKCCSPEELEAVQQAYGYFGLGAIAALLGAAQKSPGESESDDSLEEELDEAYSSVVPDDETLVDAFEKHYRSHPDEFAPVAKIDQM